MRKSTLLVAPLLIWFWVGGPEATFVPPTLAPLDRLLVNTDSYIKENPKDAHGYYILGRIHYLAFINRASLIPMGWKRNDAFPPPVAEDCMIPEFEYLARHNRAVELALRELGYAKFEEIPAERREEYWDLMSRKGEELRKSKWEPERLDAEKAIPHAAAADRSFKKAIDMDSKNGLYHLSLASLMDQFADFIKDATGVETPQELADVTPVTIRDTYYRAYNLSIRDDLKHKEMPLAGLPSLVGYEAGEAYVRWSEKIEERTEEDQKRLAEVKKNLARLNKLPIGKITPIIFSFAETTGLAGLLAPESRVSFDLDGDAMAGTWPWVKPTTGFLVWDPGDNGRITSGRQMFGSVSWWLFFSDGYHALDALDDNRDGRLSGDELAGISVWFDQNMNGRSEPGEVTPVRTLGIAALSTKATGIDDGSPMNAAGVILEDGRTLPSFDWITAPFGGSESH